MAHHTVALLVDGSLVPAKPCARGVFVFEWTGDEACHVQGALIDDRFVPRDKPQPLRPGDTFEVTRDDIVYALERIRPLERCPGTSHQMVDIAAGDEAADGGLSSDGPVSVAMPEVLLDPPELPAAWMERTYTRRSIDGLHPEPGYERELVVRAASGARFRLAGVRPCGIGSDGTMALRYRSWERLSDEE